MKTRLFVLVLCICSIQMFHSQEDDGVVSLNLPVRNSLTFNRYAINPTFSFVREQTKYISIFNKREWVQFENAPLTYLASYSGRFGENIGAGIGVFQQNYGVLTTFGGTLNFAYNAQLARDSNLTFGLNIGAYKSGVNTGNVITNFDDPSLQNVPENLLLTINPGINYGTGFLDFGVSINNLALYNFESSTLIEDNPQQSIQAHFMYTGYMMRSRGFFDESKFTGLIKSEFQKEETILSAIAMLTVPKGIWAQAGYNTRYGISGGIGINITSQIALEYNYEKAIGDLSTFGNSHDFTLAYRFKSNDRYDYSSGDEVGGLLISDDKKKPKIAKVTKPKKEVVTNVPSEKDTAAQLAAEEKAKADKEAETTLLAEQEAKEVAETQADAQAKLIAEQKAKAQADAQAKLVAEQKAKAQADAQAKLLAEQKAKEQADAQAKLLAEQKAKEEADAQAKLVAEQNAKEQADAQAKLVAEQKAKEQADAQAKLLAEQKAKEQADAQAKLLAEQNAKAQADAQAKSLAEQKVKEQTDAQAKLLAEQKAKEEADAQAKLVAEQNAKEEADAQAILLAEQKAKEQADAQAKLLAEQKAKEQADAQAKLVAEQNAEEEIDTQAKEELISNAQDDISKAMYEISQDAEESKMAQSKLLQDFDAIIEIKNEDLKDLKEENDLSDKGITVGPKPFKSITEENKKLEAIKSQLDDVINNRNEKIKELKALYNDKFEADTITNDEVYIYYQKALKRLESEQLKATQAKSNLEARLAEIKVATEFERRRRIKKAAFDNEEERYSQDRATLQNIKQKTTLTNTPITAEDFDFGEEQSGNIQILENVQNVDNGYYLVLAVHSDISKRNDFVTKVIASGRSDVDFFYDINTSKYYIYYDKYESIEQANQALESKGNRPYNQKLSLVKIEN
ncbi:PorP/SprF family type IX secretion system membrane protein [Psychroserpens luteus]|uniref:PorP/SprF family type IX secretion system membrane protein n=1 Tax=Psychroserpens luteus TaxID=1434066 RepID=A0ABW5ZMM1_9FLAO|nr:PorP/SprF family type IX secretion system membrane protein [Psychroserpens luteus]